MPLIAVDRQLRASRVELPFRIGHTPFGEERFHRDEFRLRDVGRRSVVGAGDLDSHGQRLRGVAAPQRDAGFERAHRPVVPTAGIAVGFARSLQTPAGVVVLAADQVNLRQRVEDRAGRLAHELHRAAHVERAVERLLGAPQVAEAHADLAERRQRDAEAVRRAGFLLQRDAALGQRQRLVVAVLHHRHVGLVAADRRDDVAGADHQRQALRLAQRRHGLVETPFLRAATRR